MSCPVCGDLFFDEYDMKYSKELDIVVCGDCRNKVEEHHKVDGKYIVHRCKECRQVTSVEWKKYKKKGRPIGSKNKETIMKDKAQKTLIEVI